MLMGTRLMRASLAASQLSLRPVILMTSVATAAPLTPSSPLLPFSLARSGVNVVKLFFVADTGAKTGRHDTQFIVIPSVVLPKLSTFRLAECLSFERLFRTVNFSHG